MRLYRGIALSMLVILALAATAVAAEELALTPGAAAEAAVTILQDDGARLLLRFELPRLDVRDVTLDGRTWHEFASPDAALKGADGRPALPVYSRLIALPAGARATARIVAMETRELSGYRPAPAQPREGEPLRIDEAWYAGKGAAGVPAVSTAEPGVMHGLNVAAVVVSPLGWDPADGRLTAATSMTIEVVVEGGAGKAASHLEPTASFEDYFAAKVINYRRADKTAALEPGTWLAVCVNNAAVLTELEPLLEWRRRQGYNVVVATTAQTGTTNTAIKAYLANAYATMKPALEFVTIVGDATGSIAVPSWDESLSGYGGAGDHYYSMLEGLDILPDVHIGRISVQSTSELTTVVKKIVDYETAPPTTADPGWFTRGSLCGDPSTSGITCIFVNQWVRDQLLAHQYTQIDSIYSGNYATQMMTNFSRGASLMTYRGWYTMSGMTESYITNLSNGGELGFAVIMTCDTGSFVRDALCRSEAFLRAPNGGGVASIGTATTGTHTRYNNCMFTAVIDGTWNGGDFLTGTGTTNGKLAMYANYYDAEPEHAEIWMVWNNLMGDPATEIWTGFPRAFAVDHAPVVEIGANSVLVTVTDDVSGLPVAGARVTLHKEGEVRVSGLTDASGVAHLPLSGYTAGDLDVTVAKHNHMPYRGTAVIGAATDLVGLQTTTVGGGDGDALPEPGETVELTLALHNFGGVSATNVTATLVSDDQYLTVIDGAASYGTLGGGGTASGDAPFVVAIDADAPAEHVCALDLTVTSGASTWTSLVELEISAGAFEYAALSFGGPGGSMDPGESGTLAVTLRNTGNAAVAGATAVLRTRSQFVSVSDDGGDYGAMGLNGTAVNSGDTYAVSIAGDCFGGHLAVFELTVTTAAGAVDVCEFTARIGNAAVTDPVGPDAYGYHVFDNGDTSALAPAYAWIEIDPALGGAGSDLGLTDTGWELDDTVRHVLPFDFTYYGETYDRISVCSNGWLSMGVTDLKNYRNWSLPCAGTPGAMVCAFWDNLYKQSGIGGVFQWYDAANHRLVIEWSRMGNDSGGGEETFEIVLYDPAFHPTDTGDGMIDMQFKSVYQVDGENGYSTTGIQSPDRRDGLTYSYWNRYPSGAATVAAGRALRFLPLAALPSGTLEGVVTNASGGDAPAKDVTITVVDAGRSFVSAFDGAYSGNVPAGVYDVTASHPSFAPLTVENVTISEGATTVVDFSLTDVAGPGFSATTVLEGTTDTAGPYTVETEVHDYTGLDFVKAWFMTSQAPGVNQLATVLVDPPTGRRRILIPGQPLGTRVRYWFQGLDVLGHATWEPAGGPEASYSFRVEDTGIVAVDMESDGGWTVGDPNDTAVAGVWTRVDPNGVWNNTTLVAPEDDHTPSGAACWVTGQDPVGSAQGTNDVDSGATTLYSPVYDLVGYSGVTVSYWRWYTNDTGLSPGTDIWRVQASDDGASWVDLESTTASDRSWRQVVVALDGLIDMTATVRFRIVAEDAGSGSVVEAAVDDFALHGTAAVLDTQAPTVTVTEPTPGSLHTGDIVPVAAWNAADDTGVTSVIVLYSTDAGATWSHWLGAGQLVSPQGGLAWPDVPSSNEAQMKVICFDAALNAAADVVDGTFVLDMSTAVGDDGVPSALSVARNVPNPFNPRTEIRFSLPRAGRASLKVYDLAGRLVRTLLDGELDAGPHAVEWNGETDAGERASSGVYFYRVDTDGDSATRKMLLVK